LHRSHHVGWHIHHPLSQLAISIGFQNLGVGIRGWLHATTALKRSHGHFKLRTPLAHTSTIRLIRQTVMMSDPTAHDGRVCRGK
jgi:hypothetical protein